MNKDRIGKENIKLLGYIGVIFLTIALSYKLPHDSYSLMQYMIKPIKHDNTVFYPSSIVTLVFVMIGVIGLASLERFKKRKLLVVLCTLFLLIPFMKWTIEITRTNYHSLMRDGIKSVDIEESNISLGNTDNDMVINFNLDLRDYSRHQNRFKIRVYLPESIRNLTGKKYYDLKQEYITDNKSTQKVHESMPFDNISGEEISHLTWYYEDVKYVLYNDKQSVSIIDHGY
ncbi:hypothetical protein [Anaeromicropila herbilytica]|uniref:Uncharacterized protein n=1 Tax=Anaeromicropila herbilytica TaxID=2785025 RepID=A0A7R7EI56_9FIRM|nr:hypothetical protein [Anaeromicropila herbilytica]BCN29150.1 hypothetical protein bsdtb5_04450 [Anaeromicropila herbilytica]